MRRRGGHSRRRAPRERLPRVAMSGFSRTTARRAATVLRRIDRPPAGAPPRARPSTSRDAVLRVRKDALRPARRAATDVAERRELADRLGIRCARRLEGPVMASSAAASPGTPAADAAADPVFSPDRTSSRRAAARARRCSACRRPSATRDRSIRNGTGGTASRSKCARRPVRRASRVPRPESDARAGSAPAAATRRRVRARVGIDVRRDPTAVRATRLPASADCRQASRRAERGSLLGTGRSRAPPPRDRRALRRGPRGGRRWSGRRGRGLQERDEVGRRPRPRRRSRRRRAAGGTATRHGSGGSIGRVRLVEMEEAEEDAARPWSLSARSIHSRAASPTRSRPAARPRARSPASDRFDRGRPRNRSRQRCPSTGSRTDGGDGAARRVARALQEGGERRSRRASRYPGCPARRSERQKSREDRGVRRQRQGHVRDRVSKTIAVPRERVDRGCRCSAASAGRQVVGAERVDRDDEDGSAGEGPFATPSDIPAEAKAAPTSRTASAARLAKAPTRSPENDRDAGREDAGARRHQDGPHSFYSSVAARTRRTERSSRSSCPSSGSWSLTASAYRPGSRPEGRNWSSSLRCPPCSSSEARTSAGRPCRGPPVDSETRPALRGRAHHRPTEKL